MDLLVDFSLDLLKDFSLDLLKDLSIDLSNLSDRLSDRTIK